MKILSYIAFIFFISLASCSSDDNKQTANELNNLQKVQEMSNDTHVVELYTASGALDQGYNAISLRIKNKMTSEYITNAQISWTPMMHMAMMSHSCPFSDVQKSAGKTTLYEGFAIFQMAQNDTEYWDLTINYTIDNVNYSVTDVIDVPASQYQRVTSFLGADNNRYIIAYVEPTEPKVALNEMTAAIYKMVDMTHFVPVDNFTLKIEPRMPGMGNHGSPNNIDLTQTAADDFYRGKLSLTMTGYWKINLQLIDQSGAILKGENVTDQNPASSIYFELEF